MRAEFDNTVVSNHFHSVKILLFSSARSRDFDGLIGIELPVSMYTTKTPIDTFYHQLKKILTFSVKDRYQLNYYVPPSNEGRHCFSLIFSSASSQQSLSGPSLFSSPDPKGHVSYCHHLASVVVVRRTL